MLSHMTAAWWRELINYPPPLIHVRTPRKCRSVPGVKVHQLSATERTWHTELPVTSIPQTMLDLAASSEFKLEVFTFAPRVCSRLGRAEWLVACCLSRCWLDI